MASAAAIKTTQHNAPAIAEPLARQSRVEDAVEALGDRKFVQGAEAHARALQAQLDRAFSGDIALPNPARLSPAQSTAIIVGASATLWAVIGYAAFLFLN